MIPIEEIQEEIREMGYIMIQKSNVNPSYYKLNDGTIIEALIRIDSIVEDKVNPQGFFVRSSNVIRAFVPKEKRRPEKHIRYKPSDIQSSIIESDVVFEELLSNFSEYELSNGKLLSVRTIVSQVGKTSLYTQDGETVYTVSLAPPITKFTDKKQK